MSEVPESAPDPVRRRLISASIFLAAAVALVVLGLVVHAWGPPDPAPPEAVPRVTVPAPGEPHEPLP